MLGSVDRLLARMAEQGIDYCHWKSNWAFVETLEGETDIDILVRRSQAPAFRTILNELGYRTAVETDVAPFPSVEHYHALDEETLGLVHVHVYYRVLTGGSLAKNYHLPIEEMLLGNTREIDGLVVPTPGAELIVFVLRMLVKHTGLIEPLLVMRKRKDVAAEAAWLSSGEAVEEARVLLGRHLPTVGERLFLQGYEALAGRSTLVRRMLLGRRARRALRPYARHGRLHVARTNVLNLTGKLVAKRRGSRKVLTPGTGGAVIAFVGSEATGKSTTIEEVRRWLAKRYTVDGVHVGKPPATAVSWLPNRLLPLLRRTLAEHRTTTVGIANATGSDLHRVTSLLFAVRALLLARDRASLLRKAHRRSANGTIVLCDRYPSSETGGLDSRQLDPDLPGLGPLRRAIARRENRHYDAIPAADVVVYLTAQLETTLERNRAREKREDEAYVKARYALSSNLQFEGASILRIATDGALDAVQREVKRSIWGAL